MVIDAAVAVVDFGFGFVALVVVLVAKSMVEHPLSYYFYYYLLYLN
jgi:hypothetical protein